MKCWGGELQANNDNSNKGALLSSDLSAEKLIAVTAYMVLPDMNAMQPSVAFTLH